MLSMVGRSVAKVDAAEKATGRATYVEDLYFPGMLHGKLLRSPYSHARILNIDLHACLKVPGVKAAVTGQDIPDVKLGWTRRDWYLLARDKVRFVGEAVAAVAALSVEAAEEGISRIKVDYQELPALLDPEEALSWASEPVHPEGNVCGRIKIIRGDVAYGFGQADLVVEDLCKTPRGEHCFMEPHAAIARVDASGRISLWSNTQAPFLNRATLAEALKTSQADIRVIVPFVGGAFGGKQELLVEPACILLSRKAGRPVKIVATREEEFTASTVRHPQRIRIKTGVSRKGLLLSREAEILLDVGAYCDVSQFILFDACMFVLGPYKIPHVKVEGLAVYTNHQTSGPIRGFGTVQPTFAGESQIDRIAEQLGLDPAELRLKNGLEEGDPLPTVGQRLHSVGLKQTLKQAMAAYGWSEKRTGNGPQAYYKVRGRGISCFCYASGGDSIPDFSSAFVKVNEDGTASVLSGAPDVGQGSRTVLSQIVAEELGLPLEEVSIVQADTGSVPTDFLGANASRITFICGQAVRKAAQDARAILYEAAAEMLEASPEDLEAVQGTIRVKGSPERALALKDVTGRCYFGKGQPIIGKGSFTTEVSPVDPETGQGNPVAIYIYGTQIAEVEVDLKTGQVEVIKLMAAHDCGRAINPLAAQGQIEGGAAMGLGFALLEEIKKDERGAVVNPSLADYKIPCALEVPGIVPIVVEVHDPLGPYGAKGLGEAGTIPTAPAIANAIYNAVGVRIMELPITAEKVFRALREKGMEI